VTLGLAVTKPPDRGAELVRLSCQISDQRLDLLLELRIAGAASLPVQQEGTRPSRRANASHIARTESLSALVLDPSSETAITPIIGRASGVGAGLDRARERIFGVGS
jgi:hypothetical protein